MTTLRWLHIIAGSIALASFWVPLVARKGGPVHRRAGWVYAVAMWATAVAAWCICTLRVSDSDANNDEAAWFLAFVGLLSANGAATGIRVLRRKGAAHSAGPFDIASSSLLLAASLALGMVGVRAGSTLHLAFAALGTFLAAKQLRYWLRGPTSKMDWWYVHMGNMIVACIGTVTAFLVVNVSRFGLERYALQFWLGPGVLGGVLSLLWTRHYRRKFEAVKQR